MPKKKSITQRRRKDRRTETDDRRARTRRVTDRRRAERRSGDRRLMWCGVCGAQLTAQGYCGTCRVRVVKLKP